MAHLGASYEFAMRAVRLSLARERRDSFLASVSVVRPARHALEEG